jgi:hypothetical protein
LKRIVRIGCDYGKFGTISNVGGRELSSLDGSVCNEIDIAKRNREDSERQERNKGVESVHVERF